ncbi:uncharacterized protein J4E79_010377 [Alternaria viburni]|uniref:uncharacterized protein n=1 Tax=Alternaria viburni TaxID=566460 RepID=UPI0020C1EFD3|nr:uncharacterized protein J4E79_010377 [Alternaria viburni]KAI4647226.1 hypothetical protein J4E79_010377 [Alternaria viburni]
MAHLSSNDDEMTFQIAAQNLPPELLLIVLQHWLGQQRIVIDGSAHAHYTLSYTNPENIDPFATISRTSDAPSSIVQEYFRSRIRSWLTDTKEFSDPTTFYMSHLLMSLKMKDRIGWYYLPNQPWDAICQDPKLSLSTRFPVINDRDAQYARMKHLSSLHGLEKIKLDFTAEQYFAMFDVAVPPFHYRDGAVAGDNLYRDEFCHGAGHFLLHTKELELHFGDAYKQANPWYDVQEAAWCETTPAKNFPEARLRPHVCDSGLVIDWILEYAWYNGHLQHIKRIALTGDVQLWVKEKWYDIFERHAVYLEEYPGLCYRIFATHEPDPIDLETIGIDDEDEDDQDEASVDLARLAADQQETISHGAQVRGDIHDLTS